ncbi:25938_t:CDS:10 [Gigaspora rosea]|nr:25938_t:CDS:10 [Gigaspora rosea]
METVYAIHNYCAQNDDELTFKVGDPILVLEKDEMYWDGWWQGQDILGQIGSSKNARSSVSSSGSNHSEYLSSPTRQNIDNMKMLDYSSKPNNNLQVNPLTWNVEQVCQWLKEKGFDSSYGKRVHIMNAINALKESSVLNQDQGNSLQLSYVWNNFIVDVRPESSFVKSNEHTTSWPQQINNTNEKIQLNFTNKGDKHNNKSEKHETIFSFNTKPAKKEKSQSISSEGWEFLVEEDYEKKHKNKSKSLSRKISKEHLVFFMNEHNRLHSVDESIGENEETLKNIGTPDYEGWLMKQDDKNKSWKNRFCVLKGQTLYYFQNDKIAQTLRAKGSINITGYRVIPDENILQGKYGFKLVHDIERPYYFAHENLGKMREWMKAIMKATISRDPTSPVFSSSELNTMSLAEARKLVHKKSESTNKRLQSSNGTDSPTLERSLSPTFYSTYSPTNSFNRPNPQHSSRCRSVSPLPEMSGQPVTMTFSKSKSSKSSAFKKLIKSTSFDSITINYM